MLLFVALVVASFCMTRDLVCRESQAVLSTSLMASRRTDLNSDLACTITILCGV